MPVKWVRSGQVVCVIRFSALGVDLSGAVSANAALGCTGCKAARTAGGTTSRVNSGGATSGAVIQVVLYLQTLIQMLLHRELIQVALCLQTLINMLHTLPHTLWKCNVCSLCTGCCASILQMCSDMQEEYAMCWLSLLALAIGIRAPHSPGHTYISYI